MNNSKLDSIIQTYKDHIKSVYIVGSKSVKFINNPSDFDVVIITNNDYKELKQLMQKDVGDIRKTDNIDVHVCDEEFFINHAHWHHPFCQLYYGSMLNIKDILSNKDFTKNDITLRYKGLTESKFLKEHNMTRNLKQWYHIYAVLCYLKNNSYELTEEQIKNINILHDRKQEENDERLNLVDEIIKEIELWQI